MDGHDSVTATMPETHAALNPSDRGREKKPKVVVIMGPTGSGKSKLAIDLSSYFPIEVINADSMQVYRGLDVLTNKVPLSDQRGVPHHLLGTVSPNVEFTAKEFRDSAIPLINEILARNCLPVIVGGTNYYIQALVSSFLLDDSAEDMDKSFLCNPPGTTTSDNQFIPVEDSSSDGYELLKDIDPVAANRIHPNNHRKISHYLSLYARSGVLPSTLFQGQAAEIIASYVAQKKCAHAFGPLVFTSSEPLTDFKYGVSMLNNWGRVNNLRYDCCFICVDASLPVLDRYVEQRVDCMMDAGLLNEVYDIYNLNADYTRGLRQAIGVREFEPLLSTCIVKDFCSRDKELTEGTSSVNSMDMSGKSFDKNLRECLSSSGDTQFESLLEEAIERVKLNTRRLVRRQKRMLNRLQTLFSWNIHFVDSTESISSKSDDIWATEVVEPAMKIVKSFLSKDGNPSNSSEMKIIQRDLWTQYICETCGNKVLRGFHEWEQHKHGRGHRKRVSSHKSKSQAPSLVQEKQQSSDGTQLHV